MNRVLIITYYWPPSGGAGVQRWLKFVKYLRKYNWEPVIYTPENPEYPVIDKSLQNDVPEGVEIIKRPIVEPYTAYKKFIGQKKGERINTGFLSENKKPKLTENISVWIRGNFFIPDARKFWIKPSVKFLSKYLKENPVNLIISTGPPHSMHMIALKLKQDTGIPWLADFRDPWTNIDYYKDLKLSERADRKHHKMEKEVLQNADKVVVISNGMAADFSALYSREYDVITNGFDEEDIEEMKEDKLDKKFSIAHVGTLVKTRNPVTLWKVLKELLDELPQFSYDLEIKLVGKLDFEVKQALEINELNHYVNSIDYLPHDQISKYQQQSQVLLLVINDTPNAKLILTGKFFEYIGAGRPILCIGPEDGDAAKIIKENNLGEVCEGNDSTKIRESILKYYHLFQAGKLLENSSSKEKFTRRYLTGELASLMNSIKSTE